MKTRKYCSHRFYFFAAPHNPSPLAHFDSAELPQRITHVPVQHRRERKLWFWVGVHAQTSGSQNCYSPHLNQRRQPLPVCNRAKRIKFPPLAFGCVLSKALGHPSFRAPIAWIWNFIGIKCFFFTNVIYFLPIGHSRAGYFSRAAE